MINHAFRCVYVHIPKTAGNSINRVFGSGWEDHKDLGRYAAELPSETFEGYYKFAIVRNPWERIFSDYNYQKKKSRPQPSKLFVFKETGGRRCFREWVEAMLGDPHRYDSCDWGGAVSPGIHRWSPQVDWISLNGRIAVNRVLRMEKLAEEFPEICRHLGLPALRLPRRNRRRHWHYSWYYDEATRDLVGRYYAKDIEAFGYRFESRLAAARQLTRSAANSLLALAIQPGTSLSELYGLAKAIVAQVRMRSPLGDNRGAVSSPVDRIG